MTDEVPIRYREFWDVPRLFLAAHDGQWFLFDCPFDNDTEDFADTYRVYAMPEMTEEDLAGAWDHLPARATHSVGTVPVGEVPFDPSKRRSVRAALFQRLRVPSARP